MITISVDCHPRCRVKLHKEEPAKTPSTPLTVQKPFPSGKFLNLLPNFLAFLILANIVHGTGANPLSGNLSRTFTKPFPPGLR
ncbi:MAG: hypothetical protein QHH02_01000 [Syntrophomonadaceae bacterium]|nr:hypothetical protein [Syntrophomonadaceae bacterium]